MYINHYSMGTSIIHHTDQSVRKTVVILFQNSEKTEEGITFENINTT